MVGVLIRCPDPTDAIMPSRLLCTEWAERLRRLVSIRQQLLH